MTKYGDMAQRVNEGTACIQSLGLENGQGLKGPEGTQYSSIRVRPGRDNLAWVGRVWIEGDGWVWIPLPYTTLADWETVREGLRDLGLNPILDQ